MKCVSKVDLLYDRIQALVTDSMAYCKKTYKYCHHCFLTALMCYALLIIIVNLAAEVLEKYNDL